MINRVSVVFLVALGVVAAPDPGFAQDVQHLSITQPGGMPGMPVMTGVQTTSNGLAITWDGPAGYYQVLQKVAEGEWQPLGARTNLLRREYIDPEHASAAFKVFGPAPQYVGDRACQECHSSVVEATQETAHAHALASLGTQSNNPNCVVCHTVGFGLPTGYVIPGTGNSSTPHLANVQCENCHGPAGNHAANPDDFTVKPRVEIASTVCGGCHNGAHQPTYDEWKSSAHAVVTEDMNPAGRINSCGRCHSGSVRLSLLQNEPLPQGDANMGITCVVCHDPHVETENGAQLRNPVASTEDYFLSTSDNFQTKYNPEINICAQCHNHRGAAWTTTGRPPHHSPQYNILIGTVGQLESGAAPNDPAAHAFLEKQCVTCHMQTREFESEASPAISGHTFQVTSYESCLSCHPLPEALVEFTQWAVTERIDAVKGALDLWATTKAPEALRTKYGQRAWEYTVTGSLSSGGPGPATAEQALIPDNIKKARFDMYLVLHDGSLGVHNGPYSIRLLDAAMAFVEAELSK